jgi:hypothetical protein
MTIVPVALASLALILTVIDRLIRPIVTVVRY